MKDLCKRFEEALQIERKAIQKASNQPRRSLTTADPSTKVDILIKIYTVPVTDCLREQYSLKIHISLIN